MIFTGRNEIPFWYSVYYCKRSSGYHRGVDLVGLDSAEIRCPVAGTVKSALCVTNKANKTWEWGWYVRVDDAAGNRHFFCHMQAAGLRVKAGDKVAAGTVLGLMGKTGNAALASPPIAHVHYEVRTAAGKYLDPCVFAGVPNAVGIYGQSAKNVRVNTDSLRVRTGPDSAGYLQVSSVKRGDTLTVFEEKNGWAYCKALGGWISLAYTEPAEGA